MENCKNCFQSIPDLRSAIFCNTCKKPLHRECAINDGGTFCDVCYTIKEEQIIVPEIILPSIMRRSYIELYKTCHFKFYHEVLKNNPQPPSIYAQLGIDLHTLFDKASQDRTYSKGQMIVDFNMFWLNYKPELFPSEELRPKMHQRGLTCIETFYEVTLPTLNVKPFATEETIQYSVGEELPLVQTTSDRVDLVDGMLEMSDWKTGKVMVGQKISSDLQAPLYIYGVRDKYKIPVRKFTFHYLDENKTRIFNQINNDEYVCTVGKRDYCISISDAISEVKSLFSHIQQGDFNVPRNAKNMIFQCKYCHIKEQGLCEGSDVESWRQYNGKGGW